MPKKYQPPLGVLLLLLSMILPTCAGEPEKDSKAQPYTRVRYPKFEIPDFEKKKDGGPQVGHLKTLLEADTAEVFDVAVGMPSVRLENVVITIFSHDEDSLRNLKPGEPPPVETRITSDYGFFTSRPPEPGARPEEIANLEGNVIMQRMTTPAETAKKRKPLRAPRLQPGVATEIRCEHAQWNNTLRKLNGDGDVLLLHEDSVIMGTGFLYVADDAAMNTGSGTSDMKDWGGIVFIEHNAKMDIEQSDKTTGKIERTEITCSDTASYKLREREIQFERDVVVKRQNLLIESDILKVFLRHEDEVAEEETNPANSGKSFMPGQVKNIVATIGKRPGSVKVTGYDVNEITGESVLQYAARGGRADFDFDSNRINLTDTREQRWPEVEFGAERTDRITDGNLTFVFGKAEPNEETGATGSETVLDSITTYGGRGLVELRTRNQNGDAGPTVPTTVAYKGLMTYSRADGRIRFQEKVRLRRGPVNSPELVINSEELDIRLTSDGDTPDFSQINRILANTDVEILAGGYRAEAQRAEYDIYSAGASAGSALDTLRLFGPPQATPPHPMIRDHEGNQISAPEIHMQRLSTEIGVRDQHLIVARGGIATCQFVTGETVINNQVRPKVVSIKCVRGMEYNQSLRKARFEGKVQATSDAPDDNYVLDSEHLMIDFAESPDPEKPGEYVTWVRRVTAEGDARLEQDNRVCEALNIIRDFPSQDPKSGDIYLQGAPAQGGSMSKPAALREMVKGELGSQFTAPLIKSTSTGDVIQANGPGELSMPDEIPDRRATIQFEGVASYEALAGGQVSEAKFYGGVILTRPSQGVVVTADEMHSRFIQDETPALVGDTSEMEFERIGVLRRVEGRNNVVITHRLPRGGTRRANGDLGVVEFTDSGNIIRLTADRKRNPQGFVTARDHDDLTLRAPEIEIREAQGITRASGPGDLFLPADGGTGGARVPTRVVYGPDGSLVYNELALNILATGRVRVIQPGSGANWSRPSLDGICDRLEIALQEPPAAGMTGQDAMSRMRQMDAIGAVVLRVYADPPPENPNMDFLSRPGTTFFTRGDHAIYDVPRGDVTIFCNDDRRQPQLLLNTVERGKAPQRQRMRADRFVLHLNNRPRNYNFHGNLEMNTIREGEPFDFVN